MKYFVDKNSVVREIWGKSDTILLVFVGASAEFALNKAVDWLYFTGKLPNDPLGRLFSTVNYARAIVFSEHQSALNAIDNITTIHKSVEEKRGKTIPDWAYKDVLFMLIYYSVKSFETLERPLSPLEKQEVLKVFNNVGERMGLKDLAKTYSEFEKARQNHLENHLQNGAHTKHLYKQYRKHLGLMRYLLLIETQILLLPNQVRNLLSFRKYSFLTPSVMVYKIFRQFKLDWILKEALLPTAYKADIKRLNIISE
ncbi:oxygenase MpaB family protein [Flavobacteriaceae bacterium SZ-1-7]|uniref:oxygenase MpaB family protein n=1 Tax=Tamlana sedimenti TaxID=3134126 RepID=UPI003122B64C